MGSQVSAGGTSATANPCVLCFQTCDGKYSLRCDTCDQFYHLACCGVGEDGAVGVLKHVDLFGWTCKICRDETISELLKLRHDFTCLESHVKALSAPNNSNPQSMSPGVSQPPPAVTGADNVNPPSETQEVLSYANVVKLVEKSIKVQNNRKKNIIVSGVPENQRKDDAEFS